MENAPSLFEAVCDGYNLQQAWMDVWGGRTVSARHKGAGVDGVTVAEWAQDWPARLRALQANLQRGAYQPQDLLRFDIPRPPLVPPRMRGGLEGEEHTRMRGGLEAEKRTRRLGIPTVTDRVAQRAVKNVLEPIWEAVFLSCSHGFRPGRSVFTAIAHVLWHHSLGRSWAADADIESCFDRVAHGRLLAQIDPLGDPLLTQLIAGWLRAGASLPGYGIAQGAVISPLLANIYLHPFDAAMIDAGLALVRYADDFVVMCADPQAAMRALACAQAALGDLELTLNAEKTGVVPVGPEFGFLGAQFIEG
ncbi:MAG: hypothetical protein JW934_13185 [Anaerolineae bacterium]|nr:hypothetical protein [Anaerolineae bacterium]